MDRRWLRQTAQEWTRQSAEAGRNSQINEYHWPNESCEFPVGLLSSWPDTKCKTSCYTVQYVLTVAFLPLLNLLIYTARSLFSPLVQIAPHLLSRSLDHLRITNRSFRSASPSSSLESTSCLIPPALHKTPRCMMMSHSLIHLPPAHHSSPPSHIHCFIPGSKLTFSTNLFHHSLLAPTS